jgi:hypothetical protein
MLSNKRQRSQGRGLTEPKIHWLALINMTRSLLLSWRRGVLTGRTIAILSKKTKISRIIFSGAEML